MKKKILILIAFILSIAGCFYSMYFDNNKMEETIGELQKEVIEEIKKEIIISEKTEELSIQTKEATNKNEDLSTTEEIKSTEQEEKDVIDESALETDAVVEQENISYDGDNTGKGLSLLGKSQGLTYYSQADSRWANKMYSSIGSKKQTMKTSACGPTSAAMIVSSSKGTILPTTMAQLFIDNGYRTANNGTAWSAYSFVADYFNFKEYHTTKDFNKAMSYLSQKDSKGNSKYYIIASCGSGLFTTSGHYIVLAGLDNNTIKVYDPYIYKGKFTTPSRRNANVKVNGNNAYVTKSNFKKYANYKNFWIYSNDSSNIKSSSNSKEIKVAHVKTKINKAPLRNSMQHNTSKNVITHLKKGTELDILEINNEWGRAPQGYINLNDCKYQQLIYKVTCNKLNIRSSAKISSKNIVGKAIKDTPFNILEIRKIGTYTWGRAIQGWICLNYCKKI